MNIKNLYYKIRPMAQIKWNSVPSARIRKPLRTFIISAIVSLLGGFWGGFFLWISFGFSPENSGGTILLFLGGTFMSLGSLVVLIFKRSRPLFYGLNTFTLILLVWLGIELLSQ